MATAHIATVTPEDIKLFKTTLLARRFPGLRDLDDAKVVELILAQRKATGKIQEVHRKTYPKTDFQPPPPKREALQDEPTPIFMPCNPFAARHIVQRKPEEAFVSIFSPFSADHEDFLEYKTTDERKRHPTDAFFPSSPSTARRTIEVNYFLNSADAETIAAERQATMLRARESKEAYKTLAASTRGGLLVESRLQTGCSA